MCARDPNVYLNSSQSIQKTLLHIKALYQHSPVSVCVRNDMHEILYANHSYQQLIQFLTFIEKPRHDDIKSYNIYLFLTQLEFDCFYMGTGCVLSASFECHDRRFQVRMECREFSHEDTIVIWFMNPRINNTFTVGVRDLFDEYIDSKVSRIISNLSNKNLSALSFFILGFTYSEISSLLKVRERTVRRRVEVSKGIISKEYSSVNAFKNDLFKSGKVNILVRFVYEALNVI